MLGINLYTTITILAWFITCKYIEKQLQHGSLEAFRKFQRLELKVGKAKLDLQFLKNCKKRSVIPRFLWFKVANRRLRNSSAYQQCQLKLLQDEINSKHAIIRVLSSQVTVAYSNLAALVSSLDFIHLQNVSDRENTKKLNQQQRIQDSKLFRLCSDVNNDASIDPDKVVFNFSQRLISIDILYTLDSASNYSAIQKLKP
jgi:hypothetical protein